MGINEVYFEAVTNNAEIIFTELQAINYLYIKDNNILLINNTLQKLITNP